MVVGDQGKNTNKMIGYKLLHCHLSSAAGRGRDHGGASGSSGPVNRIYALPGQQGQEAPDNVIPGILYICLRAMNVLVDLLMLNVMCENERSLGSATFEDECS